MHHSFIDKYSDIASPVHRIDPRLKIGVAVIALLCILSTPPPAALALAGFAACILATWIAARLPLIHLLKRLGLAVPFVVLIAIGSAFAGGGEAPWHRFLFIVAKAMLAIAVLTMLTSTTRFPSLLTAFEQFRMPRIISSILAFIYRYIFILIDEAERLGIGRRSRQLSRNIRLAWKARAHSIGTLFLRSLERSERVYGAMQARGYDGTMRSMKASASPSWVQFLAAGLFVAVFVSIRLSVLLKYIPEYRL
jgi:cobalt/nickel transport system permease protein